MNTVSPLYSSSAKDIETSQHALQQLSQVVNANATAPLVIQHVAASTLTAGASTTGSAIYRSHTVNTGNGLVSIHGSMSAEGTGYVGLSIDGNIVLKVPTASGSLHWTGILGKGKHISASVYGATSGTVTINPTGYTSAFSITEIPSNVKTI